MPGLALVLTILEPRVLILSMIIGEQQLKVELFPRFISSLGSSYHREAVKAME